MAEYVLNKQFNASDRSDLRCLGAFTAEGGVSSGGGTTASITTRTLTQDVAVSGATVAISTLGGVALAGSTINGVIIRNVTAIVLGGGGVTYSVGDSVTAAKWATGVLLTIDTTTSGTDFAAATTPSKAAATPIVLTPNAGTFTSGTVRVQASVTTFGAPPK